MARLHSRKRGKSRSAKPRTSTAEAWVKLSKEEIIQFVARLSKEGKTESQIGQILRDKHAVPSVKALTGKSMSAILKEQKLSPAYPSDLLDLIRRAVSMRKHLADNKRDVLNRVKLSHVESKIKRLVRYYRGNKLPANWKYEPETAALLVK
jgi:small subunit ribosomal protein S15